MRVELLLLAGAMFLAWPGGAAGQGGGAAPAETAGATAALRPGDRVALKIWNEPEMSDTFTVSETGGVILPKLGEVNVGTMGAGALQDSLRRAYAVYLRNPSVEITVHRRVAVTGEVRSPGIYLADLTMTLGDVIARAGGLTDVANPNKILVYRGAERMRFGMRHRSQLSVAELNSGDQVVVGAKNFFQRNPIYAITSTIGLATWFLTSVLPSITK